MTIRCIHFRFAYLLDSILFEEMNGNVMLETRALVYCLHAYVPLTYAYMLLPYSARILGSAWLRRPLVLNEARQDRKECVISATMY